MERLKTTVPTMTSAGAPAAVKVVQEVRAGATERSALIGAIAGMLEEEAKVATKVTAGHHLTASRSPPKVILSHRHRRTRATRRTATMVTGLVTTPMVAHLPDTTARGAEEATTMAPGEEATRRTAEALTEPPPWGEVFGLATL
mmetsp:Transcript_41141/g.92020  ORF Transcript_41141/g.92020 Transcript_41141/m.92020 type:complete len:144 (+) Transcript_41141:628-1059(+)